MPNTHDSERVGATPPPSVPPIPVHSRQPTRRPARRNISADPAVNRPKRKQPNVAGLVPAHWTGPVVTLPGYHPVPQDPTSTCEPSTCTAHTPEDHYGFHRDRAIQRRMASGNRLAAKLAVPLE